MSFEAKYEGFKNAVEEALIKRMDACQAPEPLCGAMRYSLLAGGKRIRPVLLLAACDMAGGHTAEAMPYAESIEMIHTYSLIHDDLPAMDDDDLRRGKPTNHKVYGEGMALLAGDGLLSLAFETMLQSAKTGPHIHAMHYIAKAAGVTGMVAGQCADMTDREADAETLSYIHYHKTADLFIGAVTAGLAIAKADETCLLAGKTYALSLGLAFQIMDDLLDITGNAKLLGKQTGMDEKRGKLTWPGLYGIDASMREVEKQRCLALDALAAFHEKAAFCRDLVDMLCQRDY